MRGEDGRQRAMLVVINPEQRVPKGHPLRHIKALATAKRTSQHRRDSRPVVT